MLNKVILMGRLTRDPELKYTPSNAAVVSFSLAVERNFARQGEQRATDFINCVAWRNQAEFLSKYFSKGQLLALSGSIQTRTYDDKDGKRVYVTDVVPDEIYLADPKNDSVGSSPAAPAAPSRQTTPAAAPQQAAPQQTAPQADDFALLPDDDDLPF